MCIIDIYTTFLFVYTYTHLLLGLRWGMCCPGAQQCRTNPPSAASGLPKPQMHSLETLQSHRLPGP